MNVTLGASVSRVAVNVSCSDFPQPSVAVTRIVNWPSPELFGTVKDQAESLLFVVSLKVPVRFPVAPWIFAVTDFTPLASEAVPEIVKFSL